ncbi:response regulator [Streptomyces sp. NBC_00124]|uniref:response regulator transcription factor n=1 Tax=Streptomyces sp. NBC_00124 TaxID=2975662 RepID=UPI00224E7B6D|nr:response regulator [Streptomyces sp. NBC_00124]MCX5358277.1 response regulator [Streptomyces sp. NBC_00124]
MKVHRSSRPPHALVVDADSGTRTPSRPVSPHTPRLVVLDVLLPDGDGFETYRALRAAGVDAPVLYLTAHDRTEAKARGLMMGAHDHVTKPFDLEVRWTRPPGTSVRTFSEPKVWNDPGGGVIDSTVARDGGWYYRVTTDDKVVGSCARDIVLETLPRPDRRRHPRHDTAHVAAGRRLRPHRRRDRLGRGTHRLQGQLR